MCGINRLKNAPIIRLKCSHVFHYDCVIERLTKKWNTHEVNLKFTQCPLCNQNISAFFKKWEDNQLMQEIAGFKQHLRHLITNQVQKDPELQSKIPEDSTDLFLEEGLRHLNFYECFSCQSIYFGGTRACGDVDINVSPEQLLCSGCRNHCKVHGEDHMIYKCRFCCSTASYFCFGHTHFCSTCHTNAFELLQGSNQGYLKSEVPQCTGKDTCPLKIDHPPNGEEFAIGCALCKEESEEEPLHSSSEDSENNIANNTNKPAFVIQIHTGEIPEVKQQQQSKRKRRRRKKR